LTNDKDKEDITSLLKQFLNIDGGLEELKSINYIIVNEDLIKFPIYKGEDPSISFKLLSNP
jgi:hypothetical protein